MLLILCQVDWFLRIGQIYPRSTLQLSRQHKVSRKFVAQQRDKATDALEEAFAPEVPDDEVLFYLPVTKHWLRQVVLCLMLIGHASMRGWGKCSVSLRNAGLSHKPVARQRRNGCPLTGDGILFSETMADEKNSKAYTHTQQEETILPFGVFFVVELDSVFIDTARGRAVPPDERRPPPQSAATGGGWTW